MMVMLHPALGLRRYAFQKLILLLLFLAILRPFRIVPFHLHSLFRG